MMPAIDATPADGCRCYFDAFRASAYQPPSYASFSPPLMLLLCRYAAFRY